MNCNDIGEIMWTIAEAKGLHTNLEPLPLREQTLIRLALIHTEVSETTQVVKRDGIKAGSLPAIAEELADTIIRVAELAACLELDLDAAIVAKLEENKTRPYGYGTPLERAWRAT